MERELDALREALGEANVSATLAEGRSLTYGEVVAQASKAASPPSSSSPALLSKVGSGPVPVNSARHHGLEVASDQ